MPSAFTSRDLEDIFPIGAQFAIKEPFFRSNREGYYIRIESPSDFVRLFPDSPLFDSCPVKTASTHALSGRTVEECKALGNKAFQSRRWHAAKEAYAWALSILPSTQLASSTTTLSATLLSNLAQTNLNLSLPSSARRNCLAALDLFPTSTRTSPATPLERKLLYRLSLSLYSLENYSECISTLSPLTLSPDGADANSVDLAARAHSRLLEQSQAAYDFPSLYREAREGGHLDVADYVATDAVEVREVREKGKGLVAKRRIGRGELLLACKPVAWAGTFDCEAEEAKGKTEPKTQYLAGLNLWTKSEDPWTANEAIAQLAWKAREGEERVGEVARELWAGDELRRSDSPRDAGRDVSRLEGIFAFNGFRIENLASNVDIDGSSGVDTGGGGGSDSPATGLYPSFPSALNHSCLANSSYTFLSTVFFLRARQDIEAGEELVISYLDPTASLQDREEKLERHGFVCRCQLCEEERTAGDEVLKKRQTLKARAEGLLAQGDAELGTLHEIKKDMQATYGSTPESESLTRPALYSITRRLSRHYASRGQFRDSIAAEREGLAALGAVLQETERDGKVELVSPPRVGDTNAVLSALWIGKLYKALGENDRSRVWRRLATDIERGQGGEELFTSRYPPSD